MNGLPQVSVVPIAVEDADLKLETAQWHAIERQRAAGPVNMVLTAYPYVFEMCSRTHQAVLLYGRRGGLEDIPKPESWDTLQERSRQRREAIAEAS
jgi:hypothetical protein